MLCRSRILAFVLVTALMSFASPTQAIAAAPVQVTFVDAYAPAEGVAIPLDVCVDGVTTATLTTAVKGGPFPVTAGDHLVTAYEGSDTCTGTPTISSTVRVPVAATATIVLGWGPDGPSAVVYPEPQACVPAGVAQMVLRNAGSAGSAPSVWGARSGSGGNRAVDADRRLRRPGVGFGLCGSVHRLRRSGRWRRSDELRHDDARRGHGHPDLLLWRCRRCRRRVQLRLPRWRPAPLRRLHRVAPSPTPAALPGRRPTRPHRSRRALRLPPRSRSARPSHPPTSAEGAARRPSSGAALPPPRAQRLDRSGPIRPR